MYQQAVLQALVPSLHPTFRTFSRPLRSQGSLAQKQKMKDDAARLGAPGRTAMVGNRTLIPSTWPFLE